MLPFISSNHQKQVSRQTRMDFHSLKGNQIKTKFKKAKPSFSKSFLQKQKKKCLFKNALNKTETL